MAGRVLITGERKLDKIEGFFQKEGLKQRSLRILDLGGTEYTEKEYLRMLPKSKIYVLNNRIDRTANCNNAIVADAENFSLKSTFDIIIANDIIEHLYEPERCFDCASKVIKEEGLFIITTPNLACWINRISLLLGFSLTNYSPTRYHKVGSPFFGKTTCGHKSVFNLKGITEVMGIYNFKIVYCSGFTYASKYPREGNLNFLRRIIDYILPKGLQEGILIIGKFLGNNNMRRLNKGQ